MTSNPSHTARTVSPLNVAVYVFAGSQIIAVLLPHAVLAAAAIGGGYALYLRLPEPIREKVGSKYAEAKQLLRGHLAEASRKINQSTRHAAIRIRKIISNGVLIILIWAAFIGESFHQFVETIRLCAQVWVGGRESVFMTVDAA